MDREEERNLLYIMKNILETLKNMQEEYLNNVIEKPKVKVLKRVKK